jgi:hypothetical protein
MITITKLKVVMRLKRKRKGSDYLEVETKPIQQDADHVKFAIAQVLDKHEHVAVYYYVIAEMEREGVKAYRTIVPRTLL